MIIGIPKEIKKDEYRVGIVPAGVKDLVSNGHRVLVEKNAGMGSGIIDAEFKMEGAEILDNPANIYSQAEVIIKVKEPIPSEYEYLKKGQILYAFLHLAPARELTEALLKQEIIGIAYETVELENRSLPLLIPMSEVAGRMSIHEGAKYLEREKGGRGILLGGVPGVKPGSVVIFGGGIVGSNAARMAVGTGANVTLLDINLEKLRYLDDVFGGRITTLSSNSHNILESIKKADLVIGAVLITGAKAPKLITRKMLKHMQKGSVIIDVCIDQGGSLETSRPTTHSNPTYIEEGVIHYCVTNMPGAVARTSTFALTNATFPYALELANKGFKKAIEGNSALKKGVNVYKGEVTHPSVSKALNLPCTPIEKISREVK